MDRGKENHQEKEQKPQKTISKNASKESLKESSETPGATAKVSFLSDSQLDLLTIPGRTAQWLASQSMIDFWWNTNVILARCCLF
jgi:hypothetical protein